jgi:starch-binding outer membrane protein, SusD/RagB family
MKQIINSIVSILILAGFVSCNPDFLERAPEDNLTVATFYTSAANLKAGTAPLYCEVWFDYNKRPSYILGDIRAGECLSPWGFPAFSKFTLSATDVNLLDAWKSFYTVIAQSSTIMKNIEQYATGVTEDEINMALAECRFMRANAYFYLVRLWGNVPIVENPTALIEEPKVPLRPVEDVYKYIIRDLDFAIKHLPITAEKGRVTRFSAQGMIAKVYLAKSGYNQNGMRNQADLDSAKYYAGNVCRNYPYPLLPNYEDLFKYKFNNNQECLFQLQWVPLGSWGTQNATLSDYAFSVDVAGGSASGVNVWSSTTASYDILKAYEKGDTIRRNATFFTDKSFYPYINISGGGYTYKSHQEGDEATQAHFKKYVPGGPADDNDGNVATMNSPLNTHMLRLADIYLVYAEAELGNSPSLNSGEAFQYFNKVRQRAGVNPRSSVTLDSIMYERRIEFGLESQRWYDMVTWFYFMPDKILDIINNQNREAFYRYKKLLDGNIQIRIFEEPEDPVTNVTADKIILPIPESERVANPLLAQEPVPFNFSE